MNTQFGSSINSAPPQANFPSSCRNGGNGHSQRPVIHLRKYAHFSLCGKDLDFFANAISSEKPRFVTCKTCAKARGKLLALRRKARLYDQEHAAVAIKQPERPGLVSVEDALQAAARQHYTVTERHV